MISVPLWHILDAIAGGDVYPHYQPIVSLRSGEVLGVEALARWRRHYEEPVLAATAFVPLLERAQRVTDLTAYMLDRACADLACWRALFDLDSSFRVSVNVSATELVDRRLVGLVRESIEAHRIEPSALCLEVTETARIDNFATAGKVLCELRDDVGVCLAADDYGRGYADGQYLAHFPFDTVKIDQSYVAGMEASDEDAAFVHATISYAIGRSIGVVAEGIETDLQARALLSAGCTVGQGFALAMPSPADEVLRDFYGDTLGSAATA
jgi:EAL domain-containing protein (putative c-di-GMP-specific phosphodiesterase class I)